MSRMDNDKSAVIIDSVNYNDNPTIQSNMDNEFIEKYGEYHIMSFLRYISFWMW